MKKVLFSIMTFVMMVTMIPNVYAVEAKSAGKVETLGESTGEVKPDTHDESTGVVTTAVEYSQLHIKWSKADPSIGRYMNGWWVGIKVTAPVGKVTNEEEAKKVTYGYSTDVKDGMIIDGKGKSFDQYKDGQWYIGMWTPIDEEKLKTLSEATIIQTYYFDWDGDKSVDQIITVKINPADANLEAPVDPEGRVTYVKLTIGNHVFTLPEHTTIKALKEAGKETDLATEKEQLEKVITPKDGEKFVGLYNGEELWDEEAELTEGLVLTPKFEKINTIAPSKDKTPSEKNPNTADINMGLLLGLIIISGTGITYTIKKRFN